VLGKHASKKIPKISQSDLKKSNMLGEGNDPRQPPLYFHVMQKMDGQICPLSPMPIDVYREIVDYLEPSNCLHLIPRSLIADHAMAKYHLIQAQFELSQFTNVASPPVDKNGNPEGHPAYLPELPKITDFVKAMERLQKMVLDTWTPIWDIVSRNSEQSVIGEDEKIFQFMFTVRGDRFNMAKN
jgi:hypothetical protein